MTRLTSPQLRKPLPYLNPFHPILNLSLSLTHNSIYPGRNLYLHLASFLSYWPHKDMFKYNFHTSDASEWDEPDFLPYPPNPTYYERNRVTEYLTWRPIKRADFITTKRQPSTWTELYYTNNSAEEVYVAPTVFWIDWRWVKFAHKLIITSSDKY